MITATLTGPVQAERPQQAPLPAHTASYDVLRRGKKIGEAHVSLEQRDDGIWYYRTETDATSTLAKLLQLSAKESAHFLWRDERILMLTYHQVTETITRTRYLQHRADWDEGITHVKTHEGEHTLELEEDLVDPLSIRLQMAVLLADPETRRQAHDFRLLDRDEVKDQTWAFGGQERIEVPAGCFDAIYVEREEDEDSKRTNTSWHAEAFHWMPVRILQTRKGRKEIDVRLRETSLDLGTAKCNSQ